MRAIILTIVATLSLGITFGQDTWKDKYPLTEFNPGNRVKVDIPYSKYITKDKTGTYTCYVTSVDYTKDINSAIDSLFFEIDVILKSQGYTYNVDRSVLYDFCIIEKNGILTYDDHFGVIGDFYFMSIYVTPSKIVFMIEMKG